jgi:hypothetical protein
MGEGDLDTNTEFPEDAENTEKREGKESHAKTQRRKEREK